MRCREAVRAELARRRGANPRYSLRRYAIALGVSHATLSRLLAGTRPVPARTVRLLGRGLGLARRDIDCMVGLEEAAAVLAAIARPSFRPDSRGLAVATGIPLDNVNIALYALLRDGHLRMVSPSAWVISTGDRT